MPKHSAVFLLAVLLIFSVTFMCSCGKTSGVITPGEGDGGNTEHVHVYENVADQKYLFERATCAHGNIYYVSCVECGETGKETFEDGERGEHSFAEIPMDKAMKSVADCENPAFYFAVCTVCDEVNFGQDYYSVGEPLGHDYVELVNNDRLASPANCSEPAVYYKSCSRCGAACGETFTFGEPTGVHTYIAKVDPDYLFHEGTCTDGPTYFMQCSVCGRSSEWDTKECFVDHNGPKGEHCFARCRQSKKYLAERADCRHGNIYYYSCEYCNLSSKGTAFECTFDDGRQAEHNYVENTAADGALYQNADCTTPAIYYKTCSVCGETNGATFTVGKELGHDFIEDASLTYQDADATCTEKARYYKHCSRCSEWGETFEVGEPLGHVFDWVDYSTGALKTSATCVDNEVYYYTCSRCCNAISDTLTFEKDYSALGHSYTLEIATEEYLYRPATCKEKAKYLKACERCNEKSEIPYDWCFFEAGDYAPHTWRDSVAFNGRTLKSAATCENSAVHYKTCKVCDILSDTETFEYGEPLGHKLLTTYHYKENLNDRNYILDKCSREGCTHSEERALVVPENSNIYNFIFEPIMYSDIDGTLYCKIIGYKTFYGDDRDVNLVVPETWSGAKIKYLNIKDEGYAVETLTLNESMVGCFWNSASIRRIISSHKASIGASPESSVCYTCSGTPSFNATFGGIPTLEFYDFLEERANDDYEYMVCKGTDGEYISIKKYIGGDIYVEIPETIDGYPVKYLAARSFQSDTIKRITVPDCVETAIKPFGSDSTWGHTLSLEMVFMEGMKDPAGWNDIFDGPTQLHRTYVYYYGVKNSGLYQYSNSVAFDYLVYTDDGTNYKAMILKALFTESEETAKSSYSIFLPETIDGVRLSIIGKKAFENANLASIDLLKITEIGDYAFYNCQNLTRVKLGPELKSVGDFAFRDCPLTTVTDDGSTGKAVQPGSTEGIETIGDYAFHGCKLTEFLFGAQLKSIGEYAFGFNKLTEVTLPDNLESLGRATFSFNNIRVLNFGTNKKLHEIPESAFSDNPIIVSDNKTFLEIPSSVYTIGVNAFGGNRELQKVVIHSQTVDSYAFDRCEKLATVVLSPYTQNFGKENPFRGCIHLSNIQYSGTLSNPKYMSGYDKSGSGSSALTELNCIYDVETNTIISGCKNTVIPGFITGFGESAFYGMGIEYIYIPKTVTTFGAKSLYNVKQVFLESEVNPLTDKTSNYCDRAMTGIYKIYERNSIVYAIYKTENEYTATVVYAVKSTVETNGVGGKVTILSYIDIDTWNIAYVTKINDYVFSNCTQIKEIVLASDETDMRLEEIGEGAFKGCSSLIVSCWTTSIKKVGKDAFAGTTVSMIRFYEIEKGKEFEGVEIGEGNETLTGSTSKLYYDKDHPLPETII